ncbi:unnamed protein product [Mesocestoides corti]|nr:unnamed protein product [Mesocestoides corti]
MRALLRISSSNDSTSANFLLEISNPPLQRHALAESIIYGFLGVSITNLCAVTGFICIPIKRWKYFNILLGFMTALAVGALSSTAILVLIPEAMRMIDMPAEFGGQGRSYLLKLGSVLAGALFFFVVEYVLLILPRLLKWKASSGGDKSFEGTDIADASNWHESSHGSRQDPANDEVSSVEKDVILENAESNFSDNVYISQKAPATRSSRHCCIYFNKDNFSNIAPVAWMILFGDGFHNFMDGLTIGAGFTQSPTIGIALSLSILFEELPHELGDFAVLLASGFSIKSAICANFTSACSAYLGLVIGLIIGEVSSGALYVFAITAGFFLYISLSDMLPSLRNALEEAEKNNANSFRLFLIQVTGLIVGFLCVLGVTLVSDLISL